MRAMPTERHIPSEAGSPVREEDAFDVDAALGWLRDRGEDVRGEVALVQFTGGASNLTFGLRTAGDASGAGARDLVLRRPPAGRKARGAHDMGREHRIQAGLADTFGLVPRMVGLCTDEAVIGSEFYVMERVDGPIPRRELPPGVELDADGVRRLCLSALEVLVRLHGTDLDASGLRDLGKGEGYVERQVTGWTRRYRDARTDDTGDLEDVMAWLEEHRPEDVATCLVHNDFRLDNLVLDRADPTRVAAVLDWELATLGDPLMDLAGAMAYWVQADDDAETHRFRRQPSHLPGMLTRAEVVEHYSAATGLAVSPERWRFYEVFGLFRLAVIAQQIHYRFFHGQTTNPAFARFGPAVRHLEGRCRRLVEQAG